MSRTRTRRSVAAVAAAALAGAGLVGFAGQASANPDGVLVYGLTETNQIVQFRAGTPQTILATSPIVAVAGDLEGIDVRPRTGELYGLVNGLAGDSLVVINPATGVVSRTVALADALEGDEFAFDFNPLIDRIRIVSNTGDNDVINPDTGATQASQADVFRAGDATKPDVRGAAYTQNIATPTATMLYDLDIAGADFLRTQVAAGAASDIGRLNPVGATGTDVATATSGIGARVDGAAVGFDIEAVTDNAYAVLETASGVDTFFRVNLQTGAATAVGPIGGPFLVEDIATASPRFSVGDASTTEGTPASITVTRTGDLSDTATVTLTPTAATGTATTNDFDASPKTVSFAPGAASATATVSVFSDANAQEGDETFTVVLSNPQSTGGNAALADREGTVTIRDGAAGTPSPTPSGTTAPGCDVAADVKLSRTTIIATGSAPLSVTAGRNVEVEVQAYTRPSTTFTEVRRGRTDNNGNVTFGDLRPPANTRLKARQVGCAFGAEKVLNVRTQLSLKVVRNGKQDYTFSGSAIPARPRGLIVSLYRITNDGRQVLTAQTRANANRGQAGYDASRPAGSYTINRKFTGTGRFGFVIRTGQDLQNAPGNSNVRSLLVF